MTAIEWTDETWNPTTGCDRVSPGCDHCYALTLANRLKGMGSAKYQNDGDPKSSGPGFLATEHPDTLSDPLSWRKPRKVFVNSMSDLFHERISDAFIARVFAVMAWTPRHTYQILTKRHARMRSLLASASFQESVRWYHDVRDDMPALRFPAADLDEPAPGCATLPLPNVWLGVSVENQQWADIRIPALLESPAAVRFLSCEPLLGPIDLSKWFGPVDWPPCWDDHSPSDECSRCIQPEWVIVGGESGDGFRPVEGEWVRSLRDQCERAGVAFLFKQWGGRTPKAGGRELDGRTWDEYPVSVGVGVDQHG